MVLRNPNLQARFPAFSSYSLHHHLDLSLVQRLHALHPPLKRMCARDAELTGFGGHCTAGGAAARQLRCVAPSVNFLFLVQGPATCHKKAAKCQTCVLAAQAVLPPATTLTDPASPAGARPGPPGQPSANGVPPSAGPASQVSPPRSFHAQLC